MATKCKAATVIVVITVFNKKSGLDLPMESILTTPRNQKLRALQELPRNTKVIFLDEFLMMHQKLIYFLHRRLYKPNAMIRLFLEMLLLC